MNTGKDDIIKQEVFNIGFDRGNYGNAYESNDWDSWFADMSETQSEYPEYAETYLEGLILGFFSSYEIDEIGDYEIAQHVAYCRTKWNVD